MSLYVCWFPVYSSFSLPLCVCLNRACEDCLVCRLHVFWHDAVKPPVIYNDLLFAHWPALWHYHLSALQPHHYLIHISHHPPQTYGHQHVAATDRGSLHRGSGPTPQERDQLRSSRGTSGLAVVVLPYALEWLKNGGSEMCNAESHGQKKGLINVDH